MTSDRLPFSGMTSFIAFRLVKEKFDSKQIVAMFHFPFNINVRKDYHCTLSAKTCGSKAQL